jgi:uncharacterized membrane protein YraQ (UPF0718 family)
MEWMENMWSFSKMHVPMLFDGVFIVGLSGRLALEEASSGMGRRQQLHQQVGLFGDRLMNFAMLAEVPILEALSRATAWRAAHAALPVLQACPSQGLVPSLT